MKGKTFYVLIALIILALFFVATRKASASSDKNVLVPVLMYHHVGDIESTYYVSEANFDLQMRTLKDLGYTTITATQLAGAITKGKKLPDRPIVITFDDGNPSVYTKAFPIMEKYGLVGVVYVVSNYVQAGYGLDADKLKDLVKHGWEVGSHTMSHANLNQAHNDPYTEIVVSKTELQRMLKVKVNTFAYPFGAENADVVTKVSEHYILGMGLWSPSNIHGRFDLFYIGRTGVDRWDDITAFKAKLPWSQPVNLKVK